jgi:energy-converting hydrogenase Eha subunit E
MARPALKISIPRSRFSLIGGLLASLNRMEHPMVHGPRLFESFSEDLFVSLPILYSAFFTALVPGILAQVRSINLEVAAAVGVSLIFPALSIVPFCYGLLTAQPIESAMLPFLLVCLRNALVRPTSVLKSVGALVGFSVLTPFSSAFLWKLCGPEIVPVAAVVIGREIRSLFGVKMRIGRVS